ncbi:restriction endonuclease subunit S [Streptomyces anthocyanicus]|uniref:Restriction endonuclease subunit S n=1 Tax=Streptomyces anthocyanicus TaxID=68174 RepID=A0ABZ1M942_9ACTN
MKLIPWLGESRYPVTSVKNGFEVTLGKMLQSSPVSPSDTEVPYFKSMSVQWHGIIADPNVRMWATPTERRNLTVRQGDLLICEGGDVGRAAIYDGPHGFIFQNSVHRARPFGENEIRYLKHVMQALHDSGWLDVLCNKATIRHLTGDKLGSLEIPLPDPDEQRRIADFLDTETSRIDGILRARTTQLALLQDRRAALKTQSVTYSGPDAIPHPILGSLNPEWKVTPLRRLLPAINVGVVINPSHYFTDSGVPFIHGFNVREGFISMTGMKYMTTESNESHRRSKVYAGDVLVVRAGATAGRASMVGDKFDGANCASVLILRKSVAVHPKYLETFINSVPGKGQVSFSQYGAAQEVISAGQVGSFLMSVPPLREQARRLATLEAATARTFALEEKLQRQVRLLHERRQTLISAAVTGQFDVTTASGRNVTEGVSA